MISLKKKLFPIFPLTNEDIVPTIFSFSTDSAKYLYRVPPRNAHHLMNKHQANNKQPPEGRRVQLTSSHSSTFKYQVPHDSYLKSTLTLITDLSFLCLPEDILK